MDEDRTERTLREQFRRLRAEEERMAPRFESVLGAAEAAGAARRAARRSGSPWLRLAGATAVATALLLALQLDRPSFRRPGADAGSWTALSQWSATTDLYLEWPASQGGGLADETPSDIWLDVTNESGGGSPAEKERS